MNAISIDTLKLRVPPLEYVSAPVCEVILSGSGFPSIELFDIGPLLAPGPILPPDFPGEPFFGLPDTTPGPLCITVAARNEDGVFVIVEVCVPPTPCAVLPGYFCYPVPHPGCFKFQYITDSGTTPWSEEICVIIPQVDTLPATDIT